jgi:hypothetical protein
MREITNVTNYLVISCVHLGTTRGLLNVLAQVQKYYNAKAVHLGKIATDDEMAMYARRMNKIKTWEKIDDELLTEHQQAQLKAMKKELVKLETSQEKRVNLLQEIFGKNTEFVINKEQMLPITHDWIKVDTEKVLCPYLRASSVPANGDKVSFSPITPRSFSYFRKRESSFVIPHPTPVHRSFNKEGLNQAYAMITTGSLRNIQEVNKTNDHHFVSNLPSAVLITIDNETGEFHPKRLHFETLDVPGITTPLFIADDGLIFTSSGVVETKNEDRAAYSTDDHAPFENRGVLASLMAVIAMFEPETYINGGDAGDFASVCRHTKNFPGLTEGLRLIDDLGSMRRLTMAQSSHPCIKTKVMIDSNHPKWLSDFVNSNPCLIGMLDWPSLQKLYWPSWIFTNPLKNEIYKFGDLSIRHGHQEGSLSSAADIFVKYLRGHLHAHNEHLRAGSASAGCNLGMHYLDGNVTAWSNSVTTITRFKGKTSFNVKIVLHNNEKKTSRFSYRGLVYEVNWHKYPDEK